MLNFEGMRKRSTPQQRIEGGGRVDEELVARPPSLPLLFERLISFLVFRSYMSVKAILAVRRVVG